MGCYRTNHEQKMRLSSVNRDNLHVRNDEAKQPTYLHLNLVQIRDPADVKKGLSDSNTKTDNAINGY